MLGGHVGPTLTDGSLYIDRENIYWCIRAVLTSTLAPLAQAGGALCSGYVGAAGASMGAPSVLSPQVTPCYPI